MPSLSSFVSRIIRLRSHCTIFCKRVYARATFHHTDPLECSDCKIFACEQKLAHAKKLVGQQADYLHARASEIYCELSISQVKSDLLYGIQGTCQSEREQANQSALTQAKACTQKQAFNVNAAYYSEGT